MISVVFLFYIDAHQSTARGKSPLTLCGL